MSDPVRDDELPAHPTYEADGAEQRGPEEQAGEERGRAGEPGGAAEHAGAEHGGPLGPIDWPVWAAAILGVGAGLAVFIGLYSATSQ